MENPEKSAAEAPTVTFSLKVDTASYANVTRYLESGELPLDKALEVFKYGVELSRVCSSRLETVKQEVEKIVVTDSNDVGYKLEAFQDLEVK